MAIPIAIVSSAPPPPLACTPSGRGAARRSLSSPLGLALVGAAALLAATFSTRGFGFGYDDDGDYAGPDDPLDYSNGVYEISHNRVLREYIGFDPDDAADHVARRYAHLAMPEWLMTASEAPEAQREAELRAAFDVALAQHKASHPQPGSQVAPHTLADVMSVSDNFSSRMGFLIYDPEGDRFLFMSPSGVSNRGGGGAKTIQSFINFAYMLRTNFPERFKGPESKEFAIAIGSGDYIHLSESCYRSFPHADAKAGCEEKKAPVLQFGSVYREDEILPNTIAMPMPENLNLRCFVNWTWLSAGCSAWKNLASSYDGMHYENLIPQVVWRGTDFGFLNHISISHPNFMGLGLGQRVPTFDVDIPEEVRAMSDDGDEDDYGASKKKLAATEAMKEASKLFWPRWKAVVLSAEADREAEATVAEARRLKESKNDEDAKQQDHDEEKDSPLPWADMRFTKASIASRISQPYDKFEEFGVPARAKSMSLDELAKFKYQIDLGGGGGTTWTGTLQKLAMPGLLFHHVTPTKDYIHDHMVPWVHYVPIAPDLSDLKEKYDWAEAHPDAAKMIAENGSALVQELSTPEGFGRMYEEDIVSPLRRIIEAYTPVSESHPGMEWREVIRKSGKGEFVRMRCKGWSPSKGKCIRGGDL